MQVVRHHPFSSPSSLNSQAAKFKSAAARYKSTFKSRFKSNPQPPAKVTKANDRKEKSQRETKKDDAAPPAYSEKDPSSKGTKDDAPPAYSKDDPAKSLGGAAAGGTSPTDKGEKGDKGSRGGGMPWIIPVPIGGVGHGSHGGRQNETQWNGTAKGGREKGGAMGGVGGQGVLWGGLLVGGLVGGMLY